MIETIYQTIGECLLVGAPFLIGAFWYQCHPKSFFRVTDITEEWLRRVKL